jgi:hypothetical protein
MHTTSNCVNCVNVGLEISTEKIKMLCINKELEAPINVDNKSLECVHSFTYLGSVISKNGGAKRTSGAGSQKPVVFSPS